MSTIPDGHKHMIEQRLKQLHREGYTPENIKEFGEFMYSLGTISGTSIGSADLAGALIPRIDELQDFHLYKLTGK